MRILAASDLHSDKNASIKLAEKAKKNKADLVLLGGDIVEWGGNIEGIIGPFKKANIPVMMVHGNHDTISDIDFLSQQYGKEVYNLHSYYREFEDFVIFGVGGTEFTPFSLSEKETSEMLKKNFKKFKNKKKILLTHEPPFNTKIDNIGWGHVGSKSLREFILNYKPDMVLTGHIHETFGLTDYLGKTKIFNSGKKGIIIDL
ncbi:MAG: metallophosphoesterase [Candidatus Nanoarchaeia archaeon]|nr:metallophosphoesterase [Candidatus Nanoarchaeia archaeon]MDD5054221.1 metallophosphoesterase [Candidatus Nanoarchaeia archaeon]MDD5499282.1 metallophosphoesterase [Candidatus Nanoarchaeia archaeon]